MSKAITNDPKSGIIKPALVAALIHSLRQLRRFEAMHFEPPLTFDGRTHRAIQGAARLACASTD